MSVVAEAEELAISLPESERAKLAGKLLASLPPGFDDNDTESKKPYAAAAKWTKNLSCLFLLNNSTR